MLVALCDTCRTPIRGGAFELSLVPGTLVTARDSAFTHLTTTSTGTIAATVCTPCGNRIMAVLQQKLAAPCPTCEVPQQQPWTPR